MQDWLVLASNGFAAPYFFDASMISNGECVGITRSNFKPEASSSALYSFSARSRPGSMTIMFRSIKEAKLGELSSGMTISTM